MVNTVPNIRQRILFYSALVVSSLLLLIPAFYNHYPLVNPDTATYLASGFKPETPFDRPITYGLLTRIFSLNGLSLWLVVFAQAFIVSWLIFKNISAILPGKSCVWFGLMVVLFLSLFSSLSWVVSQVQPDVFTSIAFLCVLLLVIEHHSRLMTILLYLLFFVSVAVHLSHPLLFAGSLSIFFLGAKFLSKQAGRAGLRKKLAILFILSVGSIAIMGAALSKSAHVFMVGSLLEKGVLKKYLDDQCHISHYKLCAYKDALPTKADDFWWDTASPLYKVGDWKGSKPEFNKIIRDILTTPRYLGMFLHAAGTQTVQQLCTFGIGDGNQKFPPGSNLNQTIKLYFPAEISAFNRSTQNTHPNIWEALIIPNYIFEITICLSLVALVFFISQWKHLSQRTRIILLICISGILFNVADCSVFGIVNGRYGCKMIWLLPFCVLVVTLQQIKLKYRNQTTA